MKFRIFFLSSITLLLLSSGCINLDGGGGIPGGVDVLPTFKIKLIFPIGIGAVQIESSDISLEPLLQSNYTWVYKDEKREDILDNSSFVVRAYLDYTGNRTYSDVNLLIKYYANEVKMLRPADTYTYPLVDWSSEKGPEGGDLTVGIYKFGPYGELKSGQKQPILFLGVTDTLETLKDATSPIYVQLVHKDEVILSAGEEIKIVKSY